MSKDTPEAIRRILGLWEPPFPYTLGQIIYALYRKLHIDLDRIAHHCREEGIEVEEFMEACDEIQLSDIEMFRGWWNRGTSGWGSWIKEAYDATIMLGWTEARALQLFAAWKGPEEATRICAQQLEWDTSRILNAAHEAGLQQLVHVLLEKEVEGILKKAGVNTTLEIVVNDEAASSMKEQMVASLAQPSSSRHP
jgi:hypothetical protein